MLKRSCVPANSTDCQIRQTHRQPRTLVLTAAPAPAVPAGRRAAWGQPLLRPCNRGMATIAQLGEVSSAGMCCPEAAEGPKGLLLVCSCCRHEQRCRQCLSKAHAACSRCTPYPATIGLKHLPAVRTQQVCEVVQRVQLLQLVGSDVGAVALNCTTGTMCPYRAVNGEQPYCINDTVARA